MKARLLIIEPAQMVAQGLVAMLNEQTRFKVLEPIRSLDNLTERLITGRPDIIIVNIGLVDSPTEARADRQVPVVGLVYQYVPAEKLKRFDALIDIHDSQGAVVETLTKALNQQPGDNTQPAANYELSRRETDVLIEVARGYTNKEIADRLNVSVHTVISHRKNIMHKTGIKSVAGLTVYAILNNLIDESVVV